MSRTYLVKTFKGGVLPPSPGELWEMPGVIQTHILTVKIALEPHEVSAIAPSVSCAWQLHDIVGSFLGLPCPSSSLSEERYTYPQTASMTPATWTIPRALVWHKELCLSQGPQITPDLPAMRSRAREGKIRVYVLFLPAGWELLQGRHGTIFIPESPASIPLEKVELCWVNEWGKE